MASYIIRKLEEMPEMTWRRIKAKAALQGKSLDQIIKALLLAWLNDKIEV